MMQKMNVDASLVTDSLLRACAELAHSSNSHTQNLSRPQVGKMTHCQSANVSVKLSQLSNLQMPVDDCKCDLDIAVQALKNGCDSNNSQTSCHHDATTLLSKPKTNCEVRGPVSFGCWNGRSPTPFQSYMFVGWVLVNLTIPVMPMDLWAPCACHCSPVPKCPKHVPKWPTKISITSA